MENNKYPGPFCKDILLENGLILSNVLPKTENIKNGVVIELARFASNNDLATTKVADWICCLQPNLTELKRPTLLKKISRTVELQKRFVKKKKNATFKTIEDFHHALFHTASQNLTLTEHSHSLDKPCETLVMDITPQTKQCEFTAEQHDTPKELPKSLVSVCQSSVRDNASPTKQCQYVVSPTEHRQSKVDQCKTIVAECPQSPIKPCASSETDIAPQIPKITECQTTTDKYETVAEHRQSEVDQCKTLAAECPQSPIKPCASSETDIAPPIPKIIECQTTTEKYETVAECPQSQLKLCASSVTDIAPPIVSPAKQCRSIQTEYTLSPYKLFMPNAARSSEIRESNEILYNIKKQQKQLKKLKHLVSSEKENLCHLKSVKGHFSIRNVTKRDEIATKNRKLIREARSVIKNQKQIIFRKERQEMVLKNELETVKQALFQTSEQTTVEELTNSLKNELVKNDTLLNENAKLKVKIANMTETKAKISKSNRYLKKQARALKKELKSDIPIQKQMAEKKERDTEIIALKDKVETLKDRMKDQYCTKNSDGSFSNSIRLCVIELASLEVAVEKIPTVIQVVSKHLFSRDIPKYDLPSSTSVQNIVDEGHYLAKTYASERINSAESFGLNRDGTTRKKRKIVDTTVTLDSGEIMSLGFSRVTHENAKTINEITQHHISELADMYEKSSSSAKYTVTASETEIDQQNHEQDISEQFIVHSLKKLAYTMSDRASNEKLADKLLDQWRDEVLQNCDPEETLPVEHFHCMAHVLLGFHNYASKEIKLLENSLIKEHGPLGRDCLPMFKFWANKGTVTERVVRTTSETFGPAGDHHGLRDRWEAHCSEKGIKSVIGNYRDNRFNGIFQTSAEVILHEDDMKQILASVKRNKNRKLHSVEADLSSSIIKVFLQCFGLLYVNVTGPYWNLITSGEVPYLLLFGYIQKLAKYLADCTEDPSKLLKLGSPWNLDTDDFPNRRRFYEKLSNIDAEYKKLFETIVITVTNAMLKCIEKQLVDFMPGGKYSTPPSDASLKRTGYAHVTNLGCEHHFGDLDSSQRRRPNASMHYHSSIQLLKKNRQPMMQWLTDKTEDEQDRLLRIARKGGRELRKSHLEMERQVMEEINNETLNESEVKKRKKQVEQDKCLDQVDENDTSLVNELPEIEQFIDNEYVIVAYQDAWYPGCVMRSDGKEATINFMAPTRKEGYYVWPLRNDVQTVNASFILKRGLIPECVNSGRQWYFPDHETINKLYKEFCKKYF